MQATEILKTARLKKGLSQEAIADQLGISLRNYQRYEDGKFPKYKSDNIKAIDKILETNIYDIIYDNSVPNETNSIMAGEPAIPYLESRRLFKTGNKPFLVPFVGIKAQAGYVKSYDQIQYMETLEKYSLPPGVDPRGAEWMYFEVQGDSMEDAFHAGDIILGSMVPAVDYENIRNFYVYVIVTESDLLIKRLYRKTPKKWVMISDNEKSYPQQFLNVEDIRQLWVYRKTWHTNAKPPKQFEIKI